MVKKLLFITMCLLGAASMSADLQFIFDYNRTDQTCVITGHTGTPTSRKVYIPLGVAYPGEHRNYKVIGIRSNALNGIANMDTVVIPTTITFIGMVDSPLDKVYQYCDLDNFEDCPDLKYIQVTEGNTVFKSTGAGILTSLDGSQVYLVPPRIDVSAKGGELKMAASGVAIGRDAFKGNTTIKKLTLSKNLEYISPECGIHTMTALEDIAIASGGTAGDRYQVDASALIRRQDKKILFYPPQAPADTYIVTPMYVSSIGRYAFSNTTHLSEIVVSEGVTVIEDYAFENSSVKDVWLGSTVDFVVGKGYGAFKNSQVETLTWKAKERRCVPRDFLLGCSKLRSVECDLPFHSISSSAFRDCTSLESFNQFDFSTHLVGDSIWANTGFKTVTFNPLRYEKTDQSAAKALFAGCRQLEKIDLSPVLICDDIFRFNIWQSFATDCPRLSEVWLPGFITLDKSCFEGSHNITKIVMCQADIEDGPIFTYNSDTQVRPQVFVMLPPNCIGSFESPLTRLFGNKGRGEVYPTFYNESSENWLKEYVSPSVNYVPGYCQRSYHGSAPGATLLPMFEFRREESGDKMRIVFTTIPEVTIKKAEVDVFPDYKVEEVVNNVVEFDMKFWDTENFHVDYTVHGIPYTIGYPGVSLPWNLTSDIPSMMEEMEGAAGLRLEDSTLLCAGAQEISVYDMQGRKVACSFGPQCDTSRLPQGVYQAIAIKDKETLCLRFVR